ncbi:hypothetical protein PCE1_002086 [Barthelona sp. PCE]
MRRILHWVCSKLLTSEEEQDVRILEKRRDKLLNEVLSRFKKETQALVDDLNEYVNVLSKFKVFENRELKTQETVDELINISMPDVNSTNITPMTSFISSETSGFFTQPVTTVSETGSGTLINFTKIDLPENNALEDMAVEFTKINDLTVTQSIELEISLDNFDNIDVGSFKPQNIPGTNVLTVEDVYNDIDPKTITNTDDNWKRFNDLIS